MVPNSVRWSIDRSRTISAYPRQSTGRDETETSVLHGHQRLSTENSDTTSVQTTNVATPGGGVASWLAFYQMITDTMRMRSELPGLRRAICELTVRDPTQYAAIERPQWWIDEHRWEVHLPNGGTYRVHFDLDNIKGAGVSEPVRSLWLEPGNRLIEFTKTKTHDGLLYSVSCGEDVIEEIRPEISMEGAYLTIETTYRETRHQPTDEPLILRRARLQRQGNPVRFEQPSKGELVWIERVSP